MQECIWLLQKYNIPENNIIFSDESNIIIKKNFFDFREVHLLLIMEHKFTLHFWNASKRAESQ